MFIRKKEKKSQAPPDTSIGKPGEYSVSFDRPESYKPIQMAAPVLRSPITGLPLISTRDLNHFFNLSAFLYRDTTGEQNRASSSSSAGVDAPPSYGLMATSSRKLKWILRPCWRSGFLG
ncbi:hypothetical protein F5882DRAFT_377460 [Hyaloscypha sp. PMI_1271]|nr:hypothetical protein F5882DRAFT_377460 [Hyaloscypha sp. PMI_1271]